MCSLKAQSCTCRPGDPCRVSRNVVMAGQGTLGLEIVEDLPEVTDVVVRIGGGGLMSGVSFAIKEKKPEVRVRGVETVGADAMSQALAAGTPVTLPAITSIAKTLGAPALSAWTLDPAQKRLESVTVVTDDERALVFYGKNREQQIVDREEEPE